MERSSETSPSRGARAFGQVAAMGSGAENGYEYEAPGVAVDAGELQKAREWLQPPLLWAPSRGARQLFRRGRQSRPRGVQPPRLPRDTRGGGDGVQGAPAAARQEG